MFAVLLCFKHLFAVAAPVYFVYLLRHYCRGGIVRCFGRLLIMGTAVAAVLGVAFGPFIYLGQGTLPCILGTKLLGILYYIRQSACFYIQKSWIPYQGTSSFIHLWTSGRFLPFFCIASAYFTSSSLDLCIMIYLEFRLKYQDFNTWT